MPACSSNKWPSRAIFPNYPWPHKGFLSIDCVETVVVVVVIMGGTIGSIPVGACDVLVAPDI